MGLPIARQPYIAMSNCFPFVFGVVLSLWLVSSLQPRVDGEGCCKGMLSGDPRASYSH